MNSIESRLQNEIQESKLVVGILTRLSGSSKTFLSFSIRPNCLKKWENKKDTDPNLAQDFCSTAFLSKPYGYPFVIRAFPCRCGPALAKSMSITISLIAGPFDDILPWPFKGSIQIIVFRQDNSGLIWTNVLKKNDKTTPRFVRTSPLQPNPSCGNFFYLPHEELFKAHKNIIKKIMSLSKESFLTSREPQPQFLQPWTPVKMLCLTYSRERK